MCGVVLDDTIASIPVATDHVHRFETGGTFVGDLNEVIILVGLDGNAHTHLVAHMKMAGIADDFTLHRHSHGGVGHVPCLAQRLSDHRAPGSMRCGLDDVQLSPHIIRNHHFYITDTRCRSIMP